LTKPVAIFRRALVESSGKHRWLMTRSASVKPKADNAIVRYFKDTRAEIAKVTWPTREEGLRLTYVVLIVTAVSAVVLFGVDSLFNLVIAFLLRLT
jgi:preprotein translocase subunit SecE